LGGGTAIPSKTCFSSDFVRWSVWPNFICWPLHLPMLE
jgi:hypothetical protein